MSVGRAYDDKGERETVWEAEGDTWRAESRWEVEYDWRAGEVRGDRLTEWDTLRLPGLDLGDDRLDFGGPG